MSQTQLFTLHWCRPQFTAPRQCNNTGRRVIAALLFSLSAALAACGGGGGSGSGSTGGGGSSADGTGSGGTAGTPVTTVRAPTVQSVALTLEALGVAASSVTGSIVASDPQGLALSYTLTTAPQFGTATVTPTGTVTYTINGYPRSATDSLIVSVSNGKAQATVQVSVKMASDPLLDKQWHVQNVGQDSFASTLPAASNDMNVTDAWAAGYSGKGIKVGVVDTGLEAAHEDLAANVDVAHSFNFITGGNDPTQAANDLDFDHGTAVAGIIGARAFNGVGGRGVAYNARLRGYNLIVNKGAYFYNNIANQAKAFGSDPISADNDLFNASLQTPSTILPPFSNAYASLTNTTLTLRGGLGAPIVNAAGNDFALLGQGTEKFCAVAKSYGIGCGDVASDERRGGYAPIVVGAIGADGKHSSYSNTGAGMWVVAPAGEWAYNASYADTSRIDPSALAPAILTTNRTGCSYAIETRNALDSKGAHPLAKECQYTATMNGTSAATPNVAGVVALMLEANPKLSVRDVKHILAKTAKKTDQTFAGVTANQLVLEQGWTTNAAGWSFSNRYGFGAVDASASVAMAKSYTSYLPAAKISSDSILASAPALVPPQSATGGSLVIPVGESFNTVESVVLYLNVESTPILGCNQIELRSPSGTKSIVFHSRQAFRTPASRTRESSRTPSTVNP